MSEREAPPQWVTERYKCTARGIFEAVVELVERDIKS